ncbi:cytochrome d ubiquinol oxidase subunit II [Pleionea sp. CnH1-48]|uniref:cytochrome d ubiquinol oxidase subunit II n=1 Tax=Pleionea sp. CnH1-48 TaxID=2954494 RepID=UPI002097EC46|nr:cytochrome d ubiquinol oxidase subunit II [Pleionea sp. CnH1-48]MCO7223955.1 cytochrome d ubiquinol oxidase subunit II [Pleionea sp. CnH1-48]
MDMALVWYFILGFSILMYVVLDGFDLGIGILFPFTKADEHRDRMIRSIAHVWDGNETWLVMGGVALFAAFPQAYHLLLSVFYVPIIMMLVALIFRGVAFEFRFKTQQGRRLWDGAFAMGSIFAAFTQGMILGAIIQGVPVDANGELVLGSPAWFTPFTLMTGLGVVAGYALLGMTWLIIKCDGELQHWCRLWAKRILVTVSVFVALISLWSPIAFENIRERWFSWPMILLLSPVPLLTVYVIWKIWRSLVEEEERKPFYYSISLFVLCFMGLLISYFPFIIPGHLTIWDAVADEKSLNFLSVGVAILMPMVLGYTAYNYRVFSGKVE